MGEVIQFPCKDKDPEKCTNPEKYTFLREAAFFRPASGGPWVEVDPASVTIDLGDWDAGVR
jgi:hypothetical protein